MRFQVKTSQEKSHLLFLRFVFSQARHNGQNYVFSLLTGCRDPSAGVMVNR